MSFLLYLLSIKGPIPNLLISEVTIKKSRQRLTVGEGGDILWTNILEKLNYYRKTVTAWHRVR